MSPKKAAQPKRAKSIARRPAKPRNMVPPGVVILKVPDGCDGIPRVDALGGQEIYAAGVVQGGKVLSVRGIVLGANEKIPATPPARAVTARLSSSRDPNYPGATVFEFNEDARGRNRRLIPIHEYGLNNRLVVWADFKGYEGSVMGHVCLQFEALRPPATSPPPDGHEVSSPMRGIVAANGTPRLTQAKVQPAAGGGYVLDSCVVTKEALSSAIVGIRAKIFSTVPTAAVNPNSLSAPYLEQPLPSGVTTYTMDSSTVQVPGASLGKNNYLYVWAKFSSGTGYQLATKGSIQFEGIP